MKTGIELIAQERFEQIAKHDRTIDDDVRINASEQLSDAARSLLSIEDDNAGGLNECYEKLPPEGWNESLWIKMLRKPYKERLVIAGALIAAELDRLQNA